MPTRNRSVILLAIFAAFALVLIGAGCGGDGEGGSSDEASALLEKAFTKQVNSGDLKLEASAEVDGVPQLSGPLTLSLSGPFKSDGPKDVPVLDWDILAEGAGQSFDVGLTVTDDNAFVEYQGQSYAAGAELFNQFKQQYAAQQPDEQPTLKSYGLDPASWLEDPTVEDGEQIGGDATQVVTGSVDVETAVRDLYSVTKSDAFRQQLERQGQTPPEIPEPSDEDIQKIVDAVDKLTLEVNVDENDIARRLAIAGDFTVPEGTGDGQVKGGSLSFEFILEEVGIDPQIEAPANAKPLSELIQQFAPLLGGLGGVPQTTP
jgi:hypothetical protein